MADNFLLDGFDALLNVHGSTWTFGAAKFAAVAQSGAYAAYNFIDGNTAIKILRLKSSALQKLPKKGDVLVEQSSSRKMVVRRARRVDALFSEIEVDEI